MFQVRPSSVFQLFRVTKHLGKFGTLTWYFETMKFNGSKVLKAIVRGSNLYLLELLLLYCGCQDNIPPLLGIPLRQCWPLILVRFSSSQHRPNTLHHIATARAKKKGAPWLLITYIILIECAERLMSMARS